MRRVATQRRARKTTRGREIMAVKERLSVARCGAKWNDLSNDLYVSGKEPEGIVSGLTNDVE